MATASLTAPHVAAFEAFQRVIDGGEAEWLGSLRRKAILRFQEVGFPTRKHEDWKHTDVGPIARSPFRVDPGSDAPRIAGDLIEGFTFGVLKCSQLVFVNGTFAPKLSYLRWLPDGVQVRSLGEVRRARPRSLEPHLASIATWDANPFTALNTAFFEDGAFIRLPKGAVVEEPIHLLFVSAAQDPPVAAHPRNLILLEEASQATLIESYVGLDRGPYLTNAVTEVHVGPGASLDHYKMQREADAGFHVADMAVHQDRGSVVSATSIALGGNLARNDVRVTFQGEGGDLTLNGLYALGGQQQVDNHTFIDHATPNCTSRELYKGILDGRSRGIFYGKILVRQDAQKTSSKQTNKNLLLSNEAFVDSTPGLEILADDVRCNHGSTIGQLDENAVFYLRSRGIDEEAARSLLTYAFASELINQVKVASMRIRLDQLILSRLPSAEILPEAA